jgi:hypothetical protein
VSQTAAGDDYDLVRRNAPNVIVDPRISMRVASLEDLIRARRAKGTAKDLEAAAELTAIAGESSKRSVGYSR